MKNEKYYVGLDIGTDSVGYAVTDENYDLCKFKGEPMWGVTLFEGAETSAKRRATRTSRRRLDRRQQRVQLLMELFAEEVGKNDPAFFKRIKESYLYPETEDAKVRLFGTYAEQKQYTEKYPTIHHLIVELMNSTEPHDVRLVFLACAWLVAHRGHFLSNVQKNNVGAVTDFNNVYNDLAAHIQRDGVYALPWKDTVDLVALADALKSKQSKTLKSKAVAKALFGKNKVPKTVNEEYEYNYDSLIKLLCGSSVKLKDLFDNEEYAELDVNEVDLSKDDDNLDVFYQSIGDDAGLLEAAKAVYDWSVLTDALKGKQTVSEAKVGIYLQHKEDLKELKYFAKKYLPQKYDEIFRETSSKNKDNYAAYAGKNKTAGKKIRSRETTDRESFCKYIHSLFKSVKPNRADEKRFARMIERLNSADFMPKQLDKGNRVIPYQLYWHELNTLLGKSESYLPFLSVPDENGITVADKILSVFEFRIPYFVGPLKENPEKNDKLNHWMVRKAEGKIYPWNFNDKVDLDASEEAFIEKLTNSCTYLPGEDVLPKNSLVYCAFEVLNEINNIKINGAAIPVEVKQDIYNDLFMLPKKVTPNRIRDYLISNNHMSKNDVMSGLDITVKSSLKPFMQFRNLVEQGLLTYSDAEKIILRATYSEDSKDKSRFSNWLSNNYPELPENDRKYLTGLKFRDFGRLSRRLLCGIGGKNTDTGETYSSVIRAMWETNCNLNQLRSKQFTFSEQIESIVKEYYGLNPRSISDRLDEMYVSNSVKRPIIRTLDILNDVVKVRKQAPERIFIEMARGDDDSKKGQRTKSRYEQITELYHGVKDRDLSKPNKELADLGDSANNRLQSDKLFLYFTQLGKCMYTGEPIDINSLLSGNKDYNIDHIYPRNFVKDDSVINNKVLVKSEVNGTKDNKYPIDPKTQRDMRGEWEYLNKKGLISNEKFKRLIRTSPFSEEEKFEFINRQLVETRQSTKAVASLLKELYPSSEVVYVRAGLVSDFRQVFHLPKSRSVNDLHHAKDAYLNIVAGNVWHCSFSKPFWRANGVNNAKPEVVFTNPVECRGKTVWNGATDKNRVIRIAEKNTAHITTYPFFRHSGQKGGFFDQSPLAAAKDLIPLKKGRSTELYGGYQKATVSGFVLARYKLKGKTEVSFVPIPRMHMAQVISDIDFANRYISDELGAGATDVEILLNQRILKTDTMLSLDGARYSLKAKASSTQIRLQNMMPFMTSRENEAYIRKLERFTEKRKTNQNLLADEIHDGISLRDNVALYELYLHKLTSWPFSTRPGNDNLVKQLRSHSGDFEKLSIYDQANILLQIQGLLGSARAADLDLLIKKPQAGRAFLSMKLSNWKNYTDVRIIDQSASGLFEKASANLMELL